MPRKPVYSVPETSDQAKRLVIVYKDFCEANPGKYAFKRFSAKFDISPTHLYKMMYRTTPVNDKATRVVIDMGYSGDWFSNGILPKRRDKKTQASIVDVQALIVKIEMLSGKVGIFELRVRDQDKKIAEQDRIIADQAMKISSLEREVTG